MKDIQTHLKKIRSDAAECLMLSSLTTEGKREMFLRIAEHLNALALELETSATIEMNGGGASKNEDTSPLSVPATLPVEQPRRVLPWLLAIVFCAIFGASVWTGGPADWIGSPAEKYRSFIQSKAEPPSQSNSNQAAITLLFSGEQAERKLLSDRVTALADRMSGLVGRLDFIENSLDSLKKARDETTEPSTTVSSAVEAKLPTTAEAKPSTANIRPSAEEPVSAAENRSLIAESQASTKQPDDAGPPGCTQFRSFDPRSGTYVTLDGRRRKCR